MIRMTTLAAALFAMVGCQADYEFVPDNQLAELPQGSPIGSDHRQDVSTQREPVDEVDVLWVIDNSCSMQDDQDNLTEAFPEFMNYFIGLSDLDYHIGVTSTDMYDSSEGQGRLREVEGWKWIDRSLPDPIPFFDMMARMGTDGSGDEMGRAGAYHALTTHKDDWNAGFLRDDALLSIIVISDERDSSDMDGVDEDVFLDFIDDVKFEPGMAQYSVVVGPPEGCPTADPGNGYNDLSATVGGIQWSICDNRWEDMLEELAMYSAGMKKEFYLSAPPVVETISVFSKEADGTYLDWEKDVDYLYDATRNSIEFVDYMPPPYTQIVIDYDIERGA